MGGGSEAAVSLAGRPQLWPVLAVLLAIGVRAWVAIDQQVVFNDGPQFMASARLFAEGQFGAALAGPFHPLTAFLMAVTSSLTGVGLETAGRMLSVVSGGVATAALYLLARALFDERVALVSALVFAVHPQLVEAASNVQSDGIYLALLLVGALLAWRALQSGRFVHGLGAGVVSGLAYLARPEGLAVGVVLGIWLMVAAVSRGRSWRRLISVGAGFATAVLLLGGPYVLTLQAATGSWVLTQKKRVIPLEWSLPAPARTGEALAAEGSALLRAFRPPYLVLALFALRRRRPSRATLYLFSYAALFLPVLLGVHLEAGYVGARHWLGPVALLMPFVALGCLRLGQRLQEFVLPWRVHSWATPALVGLLLGASLAYNLQPHTEPAKLARKQAALWLRTQHPDAVAAPRSRVAHYAGAKRYVPLVDTRDLSSLRDWLRVQGADYVIAEEERLPPALLGEVVGLHEVHRVEYPGGSVRVLRVETALDVASPGP